ncbi:MAG: 50S ribosomal protein L17 [Myxococcota bacterium]
MRHKNKGRKLNRTASHRSALFKNLAEALFTHERIETTHPKALELRGYAERLITLAKRGDLHARRLANRKIRDQEVLKKLFDDIAPRYASTPGGYTRVTKVRIRRGDNTVLSQIELVGSEQPASSDPQS